jgi:murein DD-endopeptidase MepM/ murein hydrolase activator NlpD
MEIASKKNYSNIIYSAIIVNADTDMDPDNSGRVQIYIPTVHSSYADKYEAYINSGDKENADGWDYFPWAYTLVDDLKDGNAVFGSTVDNQNDQYIVLGLDVNNPLNSDASGSGGDSDLSISNGNISGVLDLAMPIILYNEVGISTSAWPDSIPDDKYTVINPYDNGGWSIGLIQWHHTRAFDCLYNICLADSDWKSKTTDTNLSLYEDLEKSVKNGSDTTYRTKYQDSFHPTAGTSVYNFIKALLGSDIGKKTQRELASADTESSIKIMTQSPYSITNPAIIIFLADIMNQYGQGLTKTLSKASSISNGSGDMMSQLNDFRVWCKSNLGSYTTYINRRNTTYSYIENLYNTGKLNSTATTDLTATITSKYVPESGTYLWPVPSSVQINCFWGNKSQQAVYATGTKSSSYKWGGLWHTTPHSGIDIAPKTNGVKGDECLAIGSGTVVAVAKGSPNSMCGYYVSIKLDKVAAEGYPYVCYMHFYKESTLNVGDTVKTGDVIGYMGTTGNSTGVHLHIGLYAKGTSFSYATSTDILPYLGKKASA